MLPTVDSAPDRAPARAPPPFPPPAAPTSLLVMLAVLSPSWAMNVESPLTPLADPLLTTVAELLRPSLLDVLPPDRAPPVTTVVPGTVASTFVVASIPAMVALP